MAKKHDLSGAVLRIEKSSIYDGEGLRTVVFLKGCNLRCLWCSTPESQDRRAELGFDAVRCRDCGACLEVCQHQAISRVGGNIVIDKKRCHRCHRCREVCLHQALISYGKAMSVSEVLAEVLKDEVFFFHSGGGLTVSGGEPLLQADFVAELMRRAKEHGVNTALETSLSLPWPQTAQVLPYLDTLFVDLKHSDEKRHIELTGVSNDAILANIILADNVPEELSIIMRLPLIPALNDDDTNLRQTAALAASLKRLKYLEVLPYHRLGSVTYAKLGREYLLKDLPTPSAAYVADKCERIRRWQPNLQVKC